MRAEMESSVEPRAGNELLTDYESVRALTMRSLFDMLDRSSEGTVVVDRDARIVWMNQHYAARFGFSDPQDAIGRDCEEVIPNSLLREVVTSGEPILLDIMETERDPLVVTRLPISDLRGNVIGAVGFALFDELKALTPLFSHYSRLQAELIATRQSLAQAQARRAKYNFSSFVGNSPASLEVKRLARRAAPLDAPVLLLGETGTGKELLAHAIHGASGRADKPLVTVNVAAIPDTLLEVEFFGAAAGATPAPTARAASASSSWRMAARCSWTKSATCNCRCRASCCARCRKRNSSRWARTGWCTPMCASSRLPRWICRPWWRRAGSAPTCTTGSMC